MYERDWMDELHFGAISIGVAVATVAQIVVALLVLRPLELRSGLVAVGLVALCILGGAFSAAWKARRGLLANGLVCALLCAGISLIATAAHMPTALSVANVLFLFGCFAALGLLGGFLASRIQTWRAG
jgi:putative membrane protein (TIGR04086 family)